MTIYPDTSFLMPLYVVDGHSQEARRRMAPKPPVFLSSFHRVEVANAIFQQVFRKQISAFEARRAWLDFEQDCAIGVWVLVDVPAATFAVCADVARRHVPTLGVRTLDTLHVAAALELKATHFLTFDERQARLAEAEGLAIH